MPTFPYNYQLRTITTWNEIKLLQKQWNTLVVLNNELTVFQRFEWCSAWWHAFGNHYSLIVLCAFYNDTLVGILPLIQDNVTQHISLFASPETEYQHCIYHPRHREVVALLIDHLFTHYTANTIFLWELPVASYTAHVIKKHLIARQLRFTAGHHASFQVQHQHKTFNKQSIKARFKKLASIGETTFEMSKNITDTHRVLKLFFTWHATRFSASLSRFRKRQVTKEFKQFYYNLVELFDRAHDVTLSIASATLNYEPIASEIIIEHKHIRYSLLPSYNNSFAACSPGAALNQWSINYSFNNHFTTHDFLRGDEEYKFRFADTATHLVRYTYHPNRLAYVRALLMQHMLPNIKKLIFFTEKKIHALIRMVQNIRVLLKKTFFWLTWYSGCAWLYQYITKHRIRILNYHSISPHPLSNPILTVSPNTFREQMEYCMQLKNNNYTVEVTFDDGYKDNLTNAFPILAQHNITAKIFPTLSFIEQGYVPGWQHEPAFPALTWKDIIYMRDMRRVQFGGHTITHPNLTTCTDSELVYELGHAKAILEKQLYKRRQVTTFAYPFGKPEYISKRVIEYLKKLGYERAYTLIEGTNSRTQNPYLLKRLVIFDEPIYMFKVRVSGIIDDIYNMTLGIIALIKRVRKDKKKQLLDR